MNREDKTMLALAALTYRGIGSQSEAGIAAKLEPWLPKIETEGLGRWELVWGPASFRIPVFLVDDAMAYVARESDRAAGTPPHYVVAIRGTHPVSLFDWVFGDLWVRDQVPWSAGAGPAARLSASSALGLEIVRNLAAEVPPTRAGSLVTLAEKLTESLFDLAARVRDLDPQRVLRQPDSFRADDLVARIDALRQGAGSTLRGEAFERLGARFGLLADAVEPLQDVFSRGLMDRLREQVAAARARDPGDTLLEFLRAEAGRGARVTVTGHSKGGALANVTALWLAEDWAPTAGAEVACFSFAGPTAGNAGFARRYDEVLGDRTRRIVNRRDVVPHAWDVAELRRVGDVYPQLRGVTRGLAESVGDLAYTHVGRATIEIESASGQRELVQEIVYQHLDAYLGDAGFPDPPWSAQSIMLG